MKTSSPLLRWNALLLAACLGAAPLSAASPQEATQEAPQANAALPRALPMVLTLNQGTKLRVRARLVGGFWEVKTKDGYEKLPADQVRSAKKEADLLKESKRLAKAIKKSPVRRAAYADWLASEGLTSESLKQLDRLLKEDPELKAAREVIQRQSFRLGLPEVTQASSAEAIEALVSAALRWGPAGRELAAQKLARIEGHPALQPVLLQNLVHRKTERRRFATLALRRAAKGHQEKALVRRAVLDTDEGVRVGASLALRAFGDPKVVGSVLGAMGSKSSRVRLHASAALGHMGYRAAVPPLLAHLNRLQSSGSRKPHANFFSGNQQAYVQDFDVEVASGSSIADPVINTLTSGSVLDVGVLSASERPIVQERASIRRSLSKLTGATPGTSTKHWMQWWDENRADYQPAKKSPSNNTTSRAL